MGRKKKYKGRKKDGRVSKGPLAGVSGVMDHPVAQTVTKGGLVLLAAIAAGGAGAALGKHSLIAGVPVTLIGFHKNNPYLIAAGLGLTLSNGFQNQKAAPVSGVDGFDFKQIAEEAKDRVGTFFKNFSEKLYLPKSETATETTAGLEGNQDEQVTYFVNPYNELNELDMSAIDRIQEQIAGMNAGTSGMDAIEEPDREF
jgi:hypothetical protein